MHCEIADDLEELDLDADCELDDSCDEKGGGNHLLAESVIVQAMTTKKEQAVGPEETGSCLLVHFRPLNVSFLKLEIGDSVQLAQTVPPVPPLPTSGRFNVTVSLGSHHVNHLLMQIAILYSKPTIPRILYSCSARVRVSLAE